MYTIILFDKDNKEIFRCATVDKHYETIGGLVIKPKTGSDTIREPFHIISTESNVSFFAPKDSYCYYKVKD